ncbi:HlyD family efflux transporter periplasmic adaptor subunit [Variovorax saccharolyticus]|uniref:HlyD family efflux transporter periplasmic adaptor subunit n=1 Tax=Variovorax saccharolyticus TaxID=3053516 RepID=UPI00257706B9|nr:HlyD family efflux transporter periplasmic adaptor subunit [Variovorax sp. J31P216]MDM0029875.1 HlyD family efflux transporter periplasmic adaptor subunit [Variovorax sp. J31P216]
MKANRELRAAYLVVALLLAVLLAFFAWSLNFQVEQLARSTGQVITTARTQLVQATTDGVISEFLVREGQPVAKGDVLVTLEREQGFAALSDSRAKVAALRTTLARLRAEVLDKPLKFPPEVQEFHAFVANQTELFQRRQRAFKEETRAMQAMLRATNEELEMSLPLLASGDISRVEIIRLQKAAAEIGGQMTNRRNKYFQDAQAEMTKAEEDLATQEQVLADRATTMERTEIRAPVEGIVRTIRMTTQGGRVKAGDVVLELTPTSSALVVEGKFKPADIANLRVGLPANVKLDAYDYTIYGSLPGTVKYISPDALVEDTRAGENIYYRVHVVLDDVRPTPKGHAAIEVHTGMTAQIDVRTGSHSIFRYLTKPVTKTFSESFGER